jgi:splicing factor 3A subunit 2
MKNHLGTFECKLCLTLHTNEGSYLAHTQAKKHQNNLGRRAKEEMDVVKRSVNPTRAIAASGSKVSTVKIGRPGYSITKSIDSLGCKCLSFELRYPSISHGIVPRYRIMSSFEQRVEVPDRKYQYLLVAAAPYETVAFKIPNLRIDKREGRFVTSWGDGKFTVTLFFVEETTALTAE